MQVSGSKCHITEAGLCVDFMKIPSCLRGKGVIKSWDLSQFSVKKGLEKYIYVACIIVDIGRYF